MNHVVITGVSTGIGRATVEGLAASGYHVFGSVRRPADAVELQAQLGERFTPLLFDVTDAPAVRAAAAQVATQLDGQGLFALINNAGRGAGGPLQHEPLDEVRQILEVNLLGTLAVTQAFLPLLGASFPQMHPPGRLVNVTSVGGKIAYPFLGAYAASKHALEAASDSLRRELIIYGIDVIVIEPGTIRTPIWDKGAEAHFANRYAATDYARAATRMEKGIVARGRAGDPPERVARVIRQALESPRPKARYALPKRPISGWLIPRLLPDRWLDRQIVRRVGLARLKG